jgi:hypothetical protein
MKRYSLIPPFENDRPNGSFREAHFLGPILGERIGDLSSTGLALGHNAVLAASHYTVFRQRGFHYHFQMTGTRIS